MYDELHLSPFERTHLGRHGAFVHRVNHKHVEETKAAILARRLEEVRYEVTAPAVRLRRAA